jgi:hypothetical protein
MDHEVTIEEILDKYKLLYSEVVAYRESLDENDIMTEHYTILFDNINEPFSEIVTMVGNSKEWGNNDPSI